jgi:LysW-gamma-L-lysine carboxypeptidase
VFDALGVSLLSICSTEEGTHGAVEMQLGFRLPPGLSPAELQAFVEPAVERYADACPVERGSPGAGQMDSVGAVPVGIHCSFSGAESAYRAGKSNPLVRAFLAAIRNAGGLPRFVLKAGTSDMNVVGARWPAVPMVAYGPGDSALDHTPHECLDLDEFSAAIGVVADVLQQLVAAVPDGYPEDTAGCRELG